MKLKALVLALLLSYFANNSAHGDSSDAAIYMLHCGGCHLADGVGAPPEVPGLKTLGPITLLPEGRDYIVRVPGASQAPIDDATLTTISNYILRTFNADSLPQDFKYLSQEEVHTARQNTLMDPLKFRAELWRQVDQSDY